jgi:hypothetical protein
MSLAGATGVIPDRRHPLATVQQLRRELREADEERFLLRATLTRLRTIWPLALTVPLTAGATLLVAGWSTGTPVAEHSTTASFIEGTVIVAPPATPPSLGPQMQRAAVSDDNRPARVQRIRVLRSDEQQPIVTRSVQRPVRSSFRPSPRIPSASR